MVENKDLLKLKQKYESNLLRIKGVTGVDLNSSIIVYVEKFTPQLAQFLPRTLEGVPVKVIETGPIGLLSFPIVSAIYASRTERVRPAPGGISIGHPDISAGTLGCRARDRATRKISGLSNNHVLYGEWGANPGGSRGDPIYQPGPADGGGSGDEIGTLERWVPVKLEEPNLVDAAIFYSDELTENILEVGKPSQTLEELYPGMLLKKSGARSGLTFSKVLGVNATLKVEGWGEAIFHDQIVAMPALAIPGDSGSWVGGDNDGTVGLVYAGSTAITAICKATNIEKLLNIEIIPPTSYMSGVTMLGAWGSILGIGAVITSAFPARRM
ncbi:hypothetical protein ES707_03374 [subsurface metagenome]